MKYTTLLFIILFSHSTNGQSNVYHPFPEGNAVWNINYFLNCNWAGIANENYSIEIANDTLINLVTYHTLKTYYIESFSTGTCGSLGGPVYIYRGAIRQDTSLKKVFIVPPDSTNEELLYDFNLTVGDTVRGYLEPYPNLALSDVVISIDTIMLGSEYRKRWMINQSFNISMIEGIGWSFGLIQPSPQNVIDGPGYFLSCFSENGVPLYPDSNSICNLINTVNKFEPEKSILEVFPNPNSGAFTIKSNSTDLSKIEIYNSFGQLVLTNKMHSDNDFTFNTFAKGLFFIIGFDKNGRSYCSTKMVCE